jgi:flagellar FliJ protein
MANLSALTTLIELAQKATDAAAKRLGAALKAEEDCEAKLQMLLGYRDDYAKRLVEQQQAGMSPQAYANFVAFMGKLDQAVNGQRDVTNHARQKSVMEKTAWQAAERKRLSYRTLTERASVEALKVENKRDQKMMDDHAARRSNNKQGY